MAEPPRSELQQAPGSHIEPSQSADGSEAKGLRLEDGSRRVATSTLDNQGLLMEVVGQPGNRAMVRVSMLLNSSSCGGASGPSAAEAGLRESQWQ